MRNDMDNFRIIYKILKILEQSLDIEVFDWKLLDKEALGLSEPRWRRLMYMLSKEGYVNGIESYYSVGRTLPTVYFTNPEITLKGMEYLANHPIMERVRREMAEEEK